MGALSTEDSRRLDAAREVLDPGQTIDNPILNVFGNNLASRLGMTKVKELRKAPAFLPSYLDPASDMDDDGIADAREMVDGTQPLDDQSGDPWTFFLVNVRRQAFPLTMTLLATITGLRGIHLVLRWFGRSVAHGTERSKLQYRDP
jgi:hypothetical protein